MSLTLNPVFFQDKCTNLPKYFLFFFYKSSDISEQTNKTQLWYYDADINWVFF